MSRQVLFAILMLAFVWPASGRCEDPQPDIPPTFKLVVEPRGDSFPALKYQLLPPLEARKPGNAAPFYYRAILLFMQTPMAVHETHARESKKWLESPLHEMPKEEVRQWLGHFAGALDELKTASSREYCNWDIRLHDLRGVEAIDFRLPEFQESRGLARVLHVKARLEIAEGRFDDAIETLAIGYQLGIDVARPATLVNNLIGIAICILMNEELRELIDQPGAPNLYWAIAALPQPVISMRESMQQELTIALRMFPFLQDAEMVQRSPEQWKKLIDDAVKKLNTVTEINSEVSGDSQSGKPRLDAGEVVRRSYPVAKRELIAAGWDEESVEAMPAERVVAIQAARAYRYVYQELYKWILLPYSDGQPHLDDTYARLRESGHLGMAVGGKVQAGSKEVLPIATMLLPALEASRYAEIRLQRRLAGLQTIETLRMYAAAHQGRLPSSLDAIKEVPVPRDPYTGHRFSYRMEDDAAIIDMPAPAGRPARYFARRWEVRIDQ